MISPRHLLAIGVTLAAAAAFPVHAAGPYDGTYVGTSTNTGAGDAGCGQGGHVSRVVTDGSFTQRWSTAELRATVGADGTIDGSGSVGVGNRGGALVTIKGKITGNVMSYDVVSQRCTVHVQATKR